VEAPIWTGATTFTSGGADAMVTSGGEGLLQLQEVAGVPLDGSTEEGARRAIVAVAEMILMKSSEGWRWSGHRCKREAEGRKRGTRALVWGDGVQRERKGARGTTTLILKGPMAGRERAGGPTLGTSCGGGAGGLAGCGM
jgi:hypothetical protein